MCQARCSGRERLCGSWQKPFLQKLISQGSQWLHWRGVDSAEETAGENDTYGSALISAPGQVAGAASYTNGLAADRIYRPARPRSPRAPVPEHTRSYDVGAG